MTHRGRKFIALIACIPLWAVNMAAIVFLYNKFQSIPLCLGISLASITGVFVAYGPTNVAQKKIQGSQSGPYPGGEGA